LDLRLDSELHRVAVARGGARAELEGHAAAGARVRRDHVDRAVLAGELHLDRERAVGGLLHDHALDRALVALAVLVLEASAPRSRPEGLAGRGYALRERELLRSGVSAVCEDVEESAARTTGERGIADERAAAALLLGRPLDAALEWIDPRGRILH